MGSKLNKGTGFQPAVGMESLIRRQMLTHFPTVTQSAGFQPEPLLTTHCSLLTAHCSLLIVVLASSQNSCSLLNAHCSLLIAHCGTGFQPEPAHYSMLTAPCSLLSRVLASGQNRCSLLNVHIRNLKPSEPPPK